MTLTETQLHYLATVRAWSEEGECRFEFWSRRETLTDASVAFSSALADSGFAAGWPLSADSRTALLRAAALAPNSNLSRRRSFQAD